MFLFNKQKKNRILLAISQYPVQISPNFFCQQCIPSHCNFTYALQISVESFDPIPSDVLLPGGLIRAIHRDERDESPRSFDRLIAGMDRDTGVLSIDGTFGKHVLRDDDFQGSLSRS